jgi:uncharacterized membrane protein
MMQNVLHIIGAILGAVYILFLPGFIMSFLFFARGAIDIIERLALSFALSIAVVPLLSFYLNLVGVKIRFWSVLAEVAFVIIASAVAARLMGNFEEAHEDKHKKRG